MIQELLGEKTHYLSRSERHVGGRLYLRFSAFNGFGISFLGITPVSLLALYFGAGNLELGMLNAMLHGSGLILLVVPWAFRGKNVVSVGFWAWIIRGLICLPYGALFFWEGKPAIILIMVLYALFCLSRTVGVAMVNTVQKRLTVNRTQGEMIFRNSASFQGTSLLSRLISYVLLSLRNFAELTGLLFLPIMGIIANTAAAFMLRRIPNRTRVDYQKGKNLFVIIFHSLRKKEARLVLLSRWIVIAEIVFFGMSIPFLRRSVGLSTVQTFLYTMALGLASYLASVLLRPVEVRSGSRPLLFYTALFSVPLFLIWTFIPSHFQVAVYAILGFATMFFLTTMNLVAGRLLVRITPDKGAVGFNAMENFGTSIFALGFGLGSGFLANLSEKLVHIFPINSYGLVFFLATLGSLSQIILALKMVEPGSLSIKESVHFFSNFDNVRVWQALNTLESTADPLRRKTLVHSVAHSRAPIASAEISRILAEPLSPEKGELIDALFLTRRENLVGFLCQEASESNAFHQERAIFALGAYPGEQAEETLIPLLSHKNPLIQSCAAKSLGRIGSTSHIALIKELSTQAVDLHERLNYMIALFPMDKDRAYLRDVFSLKTMESGERLERSLYTLVSRQFGMTPPLGILYREEIATQPGGFDLLLEETRETSVFLEQEENLSSFWQSHSYHDIWKFCYRALEKAQTPHELIPLSTALIAFPKSGWNSTNTLAALYFTYQILSAREEL